MKILIVDDNKQNLLLLEAMLNGGRHAVVSAGNGIEALEKLGREKFDLIISDILMPGMDGFKLCVKCKEDEKLRAIPFIFNTLAISAILFFISVACKTLREYIESKLLSLKGNFSTFVT